MKAELRRRGRQARKRLSREEAGEKSRQIAQRLFSRPEYREAKTLFIYVSTGSEAGTGEIVAAALAAGKTVAVPLVEEDRKSLRAVPVRDPERELAPGFRGIREPADRSSPGIDPRELDLSVVPGTAFDRSGNRLGRGGGCYDRFLPRLREGVPRIGLAFECQLVEEIVPDPHDVPVDLVITEDRVLEIGSSDNCAD